MVRVLWYNLISVLCHKKIVKKRERVSKSILRTNATKRIVAFPDRNSTIRCVPRQRKVEKAAPQTIFLQFHSNVMVHARLVNS